MKKNKRKKIICIIATCVLIPTIVILGLVGINKIITPATIDGDIDENKVKQYKAIHKEIRDIIDPKIEDARFEPFDANAGDVTCTAANYEEFLTVVNEQLALRKKDITVNYTGSDYEKLRNKLELYEDVNDDSVYKSDFEKDIFAIDNPSTSNDGDFIRCNLTAFLYYAEYDQQVINLSPYWLSDESNLKFLNEYISLLIEKLKLNDLKSDEEKISVVHDYIVTIVKYDNDATSDDLEEHSAYAGLFNDTTVCSGYALLNYKILTDLGVKCRVITTPTHAWNIVQLNNKWYHLDLTWDDAGDKVTRTYYLRGDKIFKFDKDHKYDNYYKEADFLDNCSMSDDDYQ